MTNFQGLQTSSDGFLAASKETFAKAEDEEARRAQWENSKKINQLTLDFASSKNLRKGNAQRTTNENRKALLNKENSQIQLDEAWGKYEPSSN